MEDGSHSRDDLTIHWDGECAVPRRQVAQSVGVQLVDARVRSGPRGFQDGEQTESILPVNSLFSGSRAHCAGGEASITNATFCISTLGSVIRERSGYPPCRRCEICRFRSPSYTTIRRKIMFENELACIIHALMKKSHICQLDQDVRRKLWLKRRFLRLIPRTQAVPDIFVLLLTGRHYSG
jgi:hypothetical protein